MYFKPLYLLFSYSMNLSRKIYLSYQYIGFFLIPQIIIIKAGQMGPAKCNIIIYFVLSIKIKEIRI